MTVARGETQGDTPMVSVIMIFHEAAAFLEQAAESVLQQTWPAVELLLVDDGGCDGSKDIARAVRDRDPERVRLLHHPGRTNRGTGPSRMLGIDEATGQFTAFLDADDWWGPEHLAHDVALLLATPAADMVCGRSRVWNSWSGDGGNDWLNPMPFAPGALVEPPRLLAAVMRNGALATPTCSLLVRTEVLQALRRDVTSFASTYEDQVVNTLLQLRVHAVISPATDAWYRQHAESLTARAKRRGVDASQGPSPDRRAFVRWLASQPELAPGQADAQLAGLIADAVREQERLRWTATTTRRSQTIRHALARGGRAARRLRPATRAGRAAEVARLSEAWLRSWGEDLRGRLLVVGETASRAVERLGPLTGEVHRSRPGHVVEALSTLSPLDCLVMTELPPTPEELHALAKSLPTVLSPGGRLLLAADSLPAEPELRGRLEPVFGADCLDVRVLRVERRRSRPVVTVRGLRPV